MIHDLDYYRKIQGVNGTSTAKEAEIRLIQEELIRDFENTLDCEDVKINGVDAKLLITKATDLNIKNVASKPTESVDLGDIVTWSGANWIVDVIDADTRINSKGKIHRCNATLRWRDENGVSHSYPALCEDATKYSEGVQGGKILEVPDFQIKAKIRLDGHSAKLNRNKRFLLDAEIYLPQIEASGNHVSAFKVTRRNVITGNHAGHGYVELTMVECAYSDRDNPELMVADYYDAHDEYEVSTNVNTIVLAKDANFALTATAKKNGVALDQTSILFTSSDTSIATVSSAGVVRGVANGTCLITAKAGTARKEIATRVETGENKVVIHSDQGALEVVYGQSIRLSADVFIGGAKVASPVAFSISTTLASITEFGSDYVVITAANIQSNVGKEFVVSYHCAEHSISNFVTVAVRGWF